jgi:hypothetical protein
MVSLTARRAAAMACAAVLLAAGGPARAEKEDERLVLFRYYITIVVSDVCDLDVSKGQENRFNRATEKLEKKVGATKAEMDATFKQIKDGAEKSPKGFCETYRKPALETLAEFE